MSVLDRPDTSARLFVGLAVPSAPAMKLREAAEQHFGKHMKLILPEQWHLTLFFFGDVKNHAQYLGRLKQPLPQAFVPTVSITHIGRGEARDQLWAYAQPTSGLLALRQAINQRLLKTHFPRPADGPQFVPHAKLGTFYPVVRGIGLADVASPVVFSIREAHLYKSTLSHDGPIYTIEATIPL